MFPFTTNEIIHTKAVHTVMLSLTIRVTCTHIAVVAQTDRTVYNNYIETELIFTQSNINVFIACTSSNAVHRVTM